MSNFTTTEPIYAADISLRQRLGFFSKVDRKSEASPLLCHPFMASRDKDGYGKTKIAGRHTRAHRVVMIIMLGHIPQGMCVMHSCDNPCCCNPIHLSLGTNNDNIQDCIAKGRNAKGDKAGLRKHPERACRGDNHPARRTPGWCAGISNGRVKLSEQDVIEARKMHATKSYKVKDIAELFGMTVGGIEKVLYRQNWKHLP